MEPTRWHQIERVLLAALERGQEDRQEFVQQACDGDDSLRREVELLLAADERSGGFLDRMPPARTTRAIERAVPEAFASYHPIEFLGSGGRGSVYKARDTQLDRFVALKFLHRGTLAQVRRLSLEAQAQARIDHPGICKVFEVGESEGRPFIAMQYVDGVSLRTAQRAMRRDDKVRVVMQIAEALHAAHERGLIHRDVKPDNIMVEEDAGAWRPYVTDFGLAREFASPDGTTGTGQGGVTLVEGTPGYMPPEQVRGERSLMDRRVDVYGLGATLYALLGGRPPFTGEDPQEVMRASLEHPPTRLRAWCPDIPRDLEIIVMKCLDTEPDGRYSTARELAVELARYLAGSPIRARPATVTYVLGKKLRKHAIVSSVAAVTAVLMLLLTIVVIRERIRSAEQAEMAAERAELAQAFSQEAERIQHLIRFAHMSPLHDMRPTYRDTRRRMAALEQRMERLGPYAEGPGHCALGISLVALGEYQQGLEHLQRAWSGGYRTATCEYALGNALYRVYVGKLWGEVKSISDPNEREHAHARLRRQYLENALSHMRASLQQQDFESPLYVRAQIAFLEQRHDDALAFARASAAQTPWMYEARKVEADALLELAARGPDSDLEQRARAFLQARAAIESALELAPSDPGLYTRLADLLRGWLRVESARGRPIDDLVAAILQATERALLAEPDHRWALLARAWALYYRARATMNHSDGGRADLEQAAALCRRADVVGPTFGRARGLLGDIYMALGWHDEKRGQDPRASMERALTLFEQEARSAPDSGWIWNDLGVASCSRAVLASRSGEPADAWFRRCVQALERARDAALSYEYSESNLAWALAEQASHEVATGRDPRVSVARALTHATRALDAHPDNVHARNNAALAFLSRAEYEVATGVAPEESLDRVRDMCQRVLELAPDDLEARRHLVTAFMARARYAAQRGEKPFRWLDAGRAVARQAVVTGERDTFTHMARTRLELLAARLSLERGRPARRFLALAAESLARAEELSPKHRDIELLRAEYQHVLATASSDASADERTRAIESGQDVIASDH